MVLERVDLAAELCPSLECGSQNEVLSPGVPALQDSVRSREGCPTISLCLMLGQPDLALL